MKRIRLKSERVNLDPEAFDAVRRQILERDNWRCQSCGSMQNLQVHHLRYRSRMGSHEEQNLITLCAICHRRRHTQGT
jgi:5-methylcytosine-specific restriction endonuclease McrA